MKPNTGHPPSPTMRSTTRFAASIMSSLLAVGALAVGVTTPGATAPRITRPPVEELAAPPSVDLHQIDKTASLTAAADSAAPAPLAEPTTTTTAAPPPPPPPPAPAPRPAPQAIHPDQYAAAAGNVEEIIRLAAREFGIDENRFVRIAWCESKHNPNAVNSRSGALGLFQHLPRYWGARAARLGYSYDHWSDPVANARVSGKLWVEGGASHWVCKG